jgi:hypothetical protein
MDKGYKLCVGGGGALRAFEMSYVIFIYKCS